MTSQFGFKMEIAKKWLERILVLLRSTI